ncbi:MAG: molybdopterin-guanine dinucleotide biosynthesis protein B [Candidatus Accumulibacter sp.]|nr:molybdopterin-guanine dinucleotide biosynthesis protein B [Accumulibacter sp.]
MKVFGIAGYSGAGKTTLLEKIVPLLTARGWRVSVLKHAHHGFDIDRPGKDSYRHRQAGAGEVLLASGSRWVLMHEVRDEAEPRLADLLSYFSPCDLVLVEGYKTEPIAKLEVYRADNGKPPLWPTQPHIVAIATDQPLATPLPEALTVFDLNDVPAIATFILETVQLPEYRPVDAVPDLQNAEDADPQMAIFSG